MEFTGIRSGVGYQNAAELTPSVEGGRFVYVDHRGGEFTGQTLTLEGLTDQEIDILGNAALLEDEATKVEAQKVIDRYLEPVEGEPDRHIIRGVLEGDDEALVMVRVRNSNGLVGGWEENGDASGEIRELMPFSPNTVGHVAVVGVATEYQNRPLVSVEK